MELKAMVVTGEDDGNGESYGVALELYDDNGDFLDDGYETIYFKTIEEAEEYAQDYREVTI